MKSWELKVIAISKLVPHPANPNVMSSQNFKKLIRNIERTGLYEPIVVRPHPQKEDYFQIINGHHRVKALQQLGHKEADCVVWNVDDEQTTILLATLNRLSGSDILAKKIELLKTLNERFSSAELAKLLPQTKKQIDRLTNLELNPSPARPDAQLFAIPLVFFVTPDQNKTIEEALSKPPIPPGLTKARRLADALTKIAEQFLHTSGGEKCRT
jgi:ParB/RepB/Spo0J family partition protein